jgi:hypothetical protein
MANTKTMTIPRNIGGMDDITIGTQALWKAGLSLALPRAFVRPRAYIAPIATASAGIRMISVNGIERNTTEVAVCGKNWNEYPKKGG